MKDRQYVIDQILEKKLVAIARGIYGDDCLRLAKALRAGGIELLEVTFDQSDSGSLQKTADTLRRLSGEIGDGMLFGAGTVTSPEMVSAAAEAGAAFIISPNTDERVIAETKRRGLVSIPGAMTPTEIMTADRYGADFVKLFPTGVLGKDYVKSIKAPINHVKLLATGGVSADNIRGFLDLGMAGAGVGGNLCSKKLVAEGKFDEIIGMAKAYAAAVRG